MVHRPLVQVPAVYFGATQAAGAAAFAFFFAAKDGVENETAVAATAATSTNFEIVFNMEQLPASLQTRSQRIA